MNLLSKMIYEQQPSQLAYQKMLAEVIAMSSKIRTAMMLAGIDSLSINEIQPGTTIMLDHGVIYVNNLRSGRVILGDQHALFTRLLQEG